MFEKIANENERGQVGIGTLIVFIAMVLVAAIAAGVLINTAGFLQSSAEQTGQESSDQVTNQIQVASKVGIVGGQGASDTIAIQSPSGNQFAIESGSTVTATEVTDNNDDGYILVDSPQGNELAVDGGDQIRLTRESGSQVEITNEDTGVSITSSKLDLKDASGSDTLKFVRTYEDPVNGQLQLQSVTIDNAGTADSTDDGVSATLSTGENTEKYIPLTDGSSKAIIGNGETVTVTSDSDSGSTLSAGTETLSVDPGDEVLFEVTGDSEVTITNQESGSSISYNPLDGSNYLSGTAGSGSTLKLSVSDDGSATSLDVTSGLTGLTTGDFATGPGNEIQLVNEDYNAGGGGVGTLNIVAIKGSGADQINMEETTITTIGPDGTNTLTYSDDGATEDQTFAVESIQDDDDSLPVMTDSDRFRVVIDPGTLETGETMTLEVTTESGATTEIRISVPNTLAGESAVQV